MTHQQIDQVWMDLAHSMARDLLHGRPVMPSAANASAIIYLIQCTQIAQAQSAEQAEPTPAPAPQQQRRQWRRREEI